MYLKGESPLRAAMTGTANLSQGARCEAESEPLAIPHRPSPFPGCWLNPFFPIGEHPLSSFTKRFIVACAQIPPAISHFLINF
jgi:hypothetical protein